MAKYKRRAEWIWRARPSVKPRWYEDGVSARVKEEANRYVYFRKSFYVEGPVERATVDASADGRYQLFVNGQRIGRGPARCSPSWQYYDPYDIKPFLRPGRNVIAALVHSYGHDCAWYELPRWEHGSEFGCGGWFLQGSVVAQGREIILDTDATWRCLVSSAWKRDVLAGRLGYIEDYDARQAPAGWYAVDFDDSQWQTPEILRRPGKWASNDVVPFPVMVARDIPYLIEEIHWPVSIVHCGEVTNVLDAPSIQEAMQRERIEPLRDCRVDNLTAILGPEGQAEIVTTGERSLSVVLDFGIVESGRVCFEVHGPAGAVIDLAYGERIEENGRIQVLAYGHGHLYAHRVTLADTPLQWEMFDYAGFRYLQLTFRHCEQPLRVRWVAVNFTSYPVGERGKFRCSDPLLNDAYTISARTLQRCMHDGYEDCPSREQRQWTNDQYVHLISNYALFGDPYLARKLLRQVAQTQRPDGQVMMCAPGDLAATDRFSMPGFTLHWILSIGRYLEYIGDEELVQELYPSVVKGLRWFENHLDDEDLLNQVPGVLWVDWAEVEKRGQMTELNARFVGCLRVAAGFARRLGIERDADRYSALADRIAAAINRHLWDEERGVYLDARYKGVPVRWVSQEASTAAMYFGVAPEERWPRILASILDENRLVLTHPDPQGSVFYPTKPSMNSETDIVLQHAFYMHFLHAVLGRLGRGQDILANIRRRWGPQIKAGATTWWEAWELGHWHSTCHAFSCTPGYDLPTYVLGVAPLEDGMRRFRVAPQPGDLAWAEGVFPSIRGDIQVSWRWNGDQFELECEVPPATEAEVLMPVWGNRRLEIERLDDKTASGDACLLQAGQHRIVARQVQ